MLVLARSAKSGNSTIVMTNGTETIAVKVLRNNGIEVRLGFDAPGNWKILREELIEESDGPQFESKI